MLRRARTTAAALGLAVLAWQVGNAARGRFVHPFLVADLILGVGLIVASAWPGRRGPALAIFAGFAALGGVFLAASTGRALLGGFDVGTGLAGLGIVPCLVGAIGLGRWLMQSEAGPPTR